MKDVDYEDYTQVATVFDVAEPLAREIEFENDDGSMHYTPEQRWNYMRKWVDRMIKA